jgi:hypothetical protein
MKRVAGRRAIAHRAQASADFAEPAGVVRVDGVAAGAGAFRTRGRQDPSGGNFV